MNPIDDKDIRLTFEEPIGYVVFPDGFQFVVFDFKENLWRESELIQDGIIERNIIEKKDNYLDEYNEVCSLSKNILDKLDSIDIKSLTKQTSDLIYPESDIELLKKRKSTLNNISFEEYAKAKARYMIWRAESLQKELIARNEFGNNDYDGYAFRIWNHKKVILEIIGFDFEYYFKRYDADLEIKLQRRVIPNIIFAEINRAFFSNERFTPKEALVLLCLAVQDGYIEL